MHCHFEYLRPESTKWGIQYSFTSQDWPTSLEALIREGCGSECCYLTQEEIPLKVIKTRRQRVFAEVWAAKTSRNQTNACITLQMCRTIFSLEKEISYLISCLPLLCTLHPHPQIKYPTNFLCWHLRTKVKVNWTDKLSS